MSAGRGVGGKEEACRGEGGLMQRSAFSQLPELILYRGEKLNKYDTGAIELKMRTACSPFPVPTKSKYILPLNKLIAALSGRKVRLRRRRLLLV